jgi:ornithine cyclodeaminase/alanine dehydrogenase-like protein (mu-crystallin family)
LPEVLALSEADVRSLVGPEEALECMRTGFAALARGALTLPANMDFAFPTVDGEAHLKGAHIHGSKYWAVKAATGFWGNPDRGLAVTNGLFLVFSAETGILAAILFDNGYLTELRTGAAGALAADLLAPAHVEQAAIVGAGGQARYQLEALLGVRRPQRVVTTTPSREPVVLAEWVQPGTHITAMGSDFADKQELETALLGKADVIVADHPPVAAANGETHHALDAGVIEHDQILSLGALVAGDVAGRTAAEQITIADLCGIGVQDAAVAAEVMRRGAGAGLGRRLEL